MKFSLNKDRSPDVMRGLEAYEVCATNEITPVMVSDFLLGLLVINFLEGFSF